MKGKKGAAAKKGAKAEKENEKEKEKEKVKETKSEKGKEKAPEPLERTRSITEFYTEHAGYETSSPFSPSLLSPLPSPLSLRPSSRPLISTNFYIRMNTEIPAENLDKFSNPAGAEFDLGVVSLKVKREEGERDGEGGQRRGEKRAKERVLMVVTGRSIQWLQDPHRQLLQRVQCSSLGVCFSSLFLSFPSFTNFSSPFSLQEGPKATPASEGIRVHSHDEGEGVY